MNKLNTLLQENNISKQTADCILELVHKAKEHQALHGAIKYYMTHEKSTKQEPTTEFANLATVFEYLDYNEPNSILENILQNDVFKEQSYITQIIEKNMYNIGNIHLLFADVFYSDKDFKTDTNYRNQLKEKYRFEKIEDLNNAVDTATAEFIKEVLKYLKENNYTEEELYKWLEIFNKKLYS